MRNLHLLLSRLWRYRGWMLSGLLALLVVDGIQLAFPFLTRAAIDDLAQRRTGRLLAIAAAMVVIGAAMIGLRYLWRLFIIGAARRIRRELRLELYTQLLHLDAAHRRMQSTGEAMALATNDLEAVTLACGFGVLSLFDALFLILFSALAMFHLQPGLALLAGSPLLLVALFEWRAGIAVYRRFEHVQDGFALLTEEVREALSGIRTITLHAKEAECAAKLERANQTTLARGLALVRLDAFYDPVIALLAGTSMILALRYGGGAVLSGDLSLGSLVAFLAFLATMTWPMMAIGWSVNLWSRGVASMARIQAVLDARPVIADPDQPRDLPGGGDLSFDAVGVRHAGADRDALEELSCQVPAGTTLGVIGTTAAGKSTLADLLVRLLDPSRGRLTLGGCDLRQLRLSDLRRTVALVPQEPFVFALSVADNIRFARPEASAAEVETASRAACLHEEIAALPQGYATLLGERGVTISGGQRQRLAIARALLAAAPVLVLDDCLSALDAGTELALLRNLQAARRGRTTVLISHRVRTLSDAEHIIVLDQGRVVEQGRHDQLLRAGGLYARIAALQQAEQQVESGAAGPAGPAAGDPA
jgi:ATP-binding cassette subfamily B multidrug efflux pump